MAALFGASAPLEAACIGTNHSSSEDDASLDDTSCIFTVVIQPLPSALLVLVVVFLWLWRALTRCRRGRPRTAPLDLAAKRRRDHSLWAATLGSTALCATGAGGTLAITMLAPPSWPAPSADGSGSRLPWAWSASPLLELVAACTCMAVVAHGGERAPQLDRLLVGVYAMLQAVASIAVMMLTSSAATTPLLIATLCRVGACCALTGTALWPNRRRSIASTTASLNTAGAPPIDSLMAAALLQQVDSAASDAAAHRRNQRDVWAAYLNYSSDMGGDRPGSGNTTMGFSSYNNSLDGQSPRFTHASDDFPYGVAYDSSGAGSRAASSIPSPSSTRRGAPAAEAARRHSAPFGSHGSGSAGSAADATRSTADTPVRSRTAPVTPTPTMAQNANPAGAPVGRSTNDGVTRTTGESSNPFGCDATATGAASCALVVADRATVPSGNPFGACDPPSHGSGGGTNPFGVAGANPFGDSIGQGSPVPPGVGALFASREHSSAPTSNYGSPPSEAGGPLALMHRPSALPTLSDERWTEPLVTVEVLGHMLVPDMDESGKPGELHLEYMLRTVGDEHEGARLVQRRYRDFEKLATSLSALAKQGNTAVPPLPSNLTFGRNLSTEFANQRKEALESWLSRVMARPALWGDALRLFLGLAEEGTPGDSSLANSPDGGGGNIDEGDDQNGEEYHAQLAWIVQRAQQSGGVATEGTGFFRGSTFVRWLTTQALVGSREQAVALAEAMRRRGLICPVGEQTPFRDGSTQYRFVSTPT